MHPIMALYRQQELHSDQISNLTSQHDEQVWRSVSNMTGLRIVMDWTPGKLSLAKLLKREIRLAKNAKQHLEWKWYEALDETAELAEGLLIAGYKADDLEAFMVAAIDQLVLPESGLKVCKAQSFADLSLVFALQQEVWQAPMSERLQAAYEGWLAEPQRVSYFWVEIDGKAVSSAWIDYTPGSEFAGLWAGSTLQEYRGRGCYHALIKARAEEAKSRGRRYLTIDAAPTSEPIVTSLGFETISLTRPYVVNI